MELEMEHVFDGLSNFRFRSAWTSDDDKTVLLFWLISFSNADLAARIRNQTINLSLARLTESL